MAHTDEKKKQLRAVYVYERQPLEQAAKKLNIPAGTAKRWKLLARADGDDWDKGRAAVSLGDENFTQLSLALLQDYLVQHQAAIDALRQQKDMGALDRATALASLGDSFNKTMATFKKLSPEVNKLAIALDVMQRLVTYMQGHKPAQLPELLTVLEPFGIELHKAYG